MKSRSVYVSVVLCCCLTYFATVVNADQIRSTDFQRPVIEDFNNLNELGLGFNDPFSFCAGEEDYPTPLRLGRLTITTDGGLFNYFDTGDGSCCGGAIRGFGPAIGNSFSDTGHFDVVFDRPVSQAGGWVGSGAGPVFFFDAENRLLGTVTLSLAQNKFRVPPSPQFGGWEDRSGIKRIRFTDVTTNNGILVLDRVTYGDLEPTPEPSSCWLLTAGLIAAARWRIPARKSRTDGGVEPELL